MFPSLTRNLLGGCLRKDMLRIWFFCGPDSNGDGDALPDRPGSLGVLMDQNRVFPERIRLNKKTPVRDIGFLVERQPIPRRWKRLRDHEHERVEGDVGKRRLTSETDFRKGIG